MRRKRRRRRERERERERGERVGTLPWLLGPPGEHCRDEQMEKKNIHQLHSNTLTIRQLTSRKVDL